MNHDHIYHLVASGAGESELQDTLTLNLSLLARGCCFAPIQDEYIAFSQFPLGRDSVDFVVFNSRSKMNIVFVEIKGADFTFLNKDGAPSAAIGVAAAQIRDRFDFVESNCEPMRREFHNIRSRVLRGESLYRSQLGPAGLPEVDANKDITIEGVVIGGVTHDDILESHAKKLLKKESPRITFESWPSWLRKYGGMECARR